MRRSSVTAASGLLILILGIANLWMGSAKLEEYRAVSAQALAAGGPDAAEPFRGTASILDRTSDAQLLYESAAIKIAYYRVVRRGGRALVAAGAFLLAGAILRRTLVPAR